MSADNNDLSESSVSGGLLDRTIVKPLTDWWARRVALDESISLDEHTLKDIGISRGEIAGIATGKIVPLRAAKENPPQRQGIMRHKSEARFDAELNGSAIATETNADRRAH